MSGPVEEGLYDRVVTESVAEALALTDPELIDSASLPAAEAADRLAWHLGRQITRTIEALPESERSTTGALIARQLIDQLRRHVRQTILDGQDPLDPPRILRSVGRRMPDRTVRHASAPLTPLLDTTLLTNSPGEPGVGYEIEREINSADGIDVVIAFVRFSGLRPLRDALRQHCDSGKRLRVLTTTYTGSTEQRALDMLVELGAEVRVSYDVSSTRLHAKSWLFDRRSSFSTAYVGSSNLTHSAQVTGIEWNVRISGARNPSVIDKIRAVFDTYWQHPDFVDYEPTRFRREVSRPADSTALSPVQVCLEPFQRRLLELVEVERSRGRHRNLLVAATGTGKTVMAAVDYVALRQRLARSRLLFVAHREELLEQALRTYRQALSDHAFGELWVGRHRPERFEHVFASVQSLAVADLDVIAVDHFDVVVVDEFHHAAARTYAGVLDRLQPRELLGLTATPERSDGLDVLHWFGGRIAAELRLWDAIEQHRLTPFVYYGIHDGTDLRDVPWRRGQGYELTALTELYTGNDHWARLVHQQVLDHVDDPNTMRCLGFCVSVEHAEFMADRFRHFGIAAVAVSGRTPENQRRRAITDLAAGTVRVVFSVDLFNEGVDVPAVDVVLLLRPTESATLFLQQMGRGLRVSPGKTHCTVLDLVGQQRREFRFDLKFRALLGGSRRDLQTAVQQGFPYLPGGCRLELDAVARDVVLRSIREAIPSRWPAKVAELRALHAAGAPVGLTDFLEQTGLDLSDVYDGRRGWSDLCQDAGAATAAPGPHEATFRRAVGRLLHVDDPLRLQTLTGLVAGPGVPQVDRMSPEQARLTRMLVVSIAGSTLGAGASVQDGVDLVWQHPQVVTEVGELAGVLAGRIDHVQAPALAGVPLQVHARYTRQEILAAVGEGDGRVPDWREGVYNAKGAGADLLAFTLDKTVGHFSPTTRYRDYAVSPELIHWESQSTTSADSPTGLRYRQHRETGRHILLFARTRSDERSFWFLGQADYFSHQGERPMAITWRLRTPLSGDLFMAFAAAVA